jgi:YVTN family beta-propeller protein
MNKLVIAMAVVLAAAAGSAVAKGDAAAGQTKAASGCAGCHGANGVSPTDAFPNLAGQGYTYLVSQIKAFRAGMRKNPLMESASRALTDQDIENLATYFSGLKPGAPAVALTSTATPAPIVPHPPIISGGLLKPHPHPTRQYWADKLPPGEGRDIIVQKCQLCHDLQRAIAYARPKEQWQHVMGSMIRRGSPVSPEELPTAVSYLTKFFGPDSPSIAEVGIKACKPSEWPRGTSDFRSKWKGQYTVWVSNQQGGGIDIVDPASNTIVHRIQCVSGADRVEFSRDGNIAYAPDRIEHNVTVIDTRTGAITAKVPLIDRPNTSVLSRDFKKLYVGIWPVRADEHTRGFVQVVDTTTLKVVKTIPTKGGIHDPWMSADGKLLLAMSPPGKFMNVYDTTQDEKLLYTCCTEAEIGTMNMETRADGSTSRIFFSYSGYYGVVIIDPKTGKELQRVPHSLNAAQAAATSGSESYLSASGSGFHGGEISPDGKNYWVITGSVVYRYELPSFKPLGNVRLAPVDQSGRRFTPAVEGTWLTISPDGQKVYGVRPGRNLMSVIDVKTMKEEALIPTGEYPLHISVWPRGTP